MALANAIEKARSYSMPKDNIDRAIAKGSGDGRGRLVFESVVYEGYGPEGVAVIVEALTDNRNRTAADVRHLFTKHGGNLGTTGAVAWQFERRGWSSSPPTASTRRRSSSRPRMPGPTTSSRTARCSRSRARRSSFSPCGTRSRRPDSRSTSAELSMVPKVTVAIDDDSTAKQVVRLVEALEDNDDVQDVYANFDIPEAVLEAAVSVGSGSVSRIVRADEGQIVRRADDARRSAAYREPHEQRRLHPPRL